VIGDISFGQRFGKSSPLKKPHMVCQVY
jgi:hypothetical protein